MSADVPTDVEVRLGPVPDRLADVRESGVVYQVGPREFRLALDGVATYWVRDGHTIVIDQHAGAYEDEVRVFLLGSVFGALLHQRGVLPLHASAIQVDGRCVAVLGPSGLGKSTLAAAFSTAGYPVVADDVLAVHADGNGAPVCSPGYPELKLWADAARRLGIDTTELRPFQGLRRKFALPVAGVGDRKPLRLTRIYALSYSDDDSLSLEPLEGGRKLAALIENTYRFQYLHGMDRRPDHFRLCARLGESVTLRRVRRPRRRFLLKRLMRLIERDWTRE